MMMILILQESAHSMPEPGVEALVTQTVAWLELGVEAFGALIIGIGVLIAIFRIIRAVGSGEVEAYNRIRLGLSRFLAMALEFQLAADILATAISPSWDHLGRLGAIAALRTGLNYFLSREIAEEEEGAKDARAGHAAAAENAAS